jgi:hypothetical protein
MGLFNFGPRIEVYCNLSAPPRVEEGKIRVRRSRKSRNTLEFIRSPQSSKHSPRPNPTAQVTESAPDEYLTRRSGSFSPPSETPPEQHHSHYYYYHHHRHYHPYHRHHLEPPHQAVSRDPAPAELPTTNASREGLNPQTMQQVELDAELRSMTHGSRMNKLRLPECAAYSSNMAEYQSVPPASSDHIPDVGAVWELPTWDRTMEKLEDDLRTKIFIRIMDDSKRIDPEIPKANLPGDFGCVFYGR